MKRRPGRVSSRETNGRTFRAWCAFRLRINNEAQAPLPCGPAGVKNFDAGVRSRGATNRLNLQQFRLVFGKVAAAPGVRHRNRGDQRYGAHPGHIPEESRLDPDRLEPERNVFCAAAKRRIGDRIGEPYAERTHVHREKLRLHQPADRRIEADARQRKNHPASFDRPPEKILMRNRAR